MQLPPFGQQSFPALLVFRVGFTGALEADLNTAWLFIPANAFSAPVGVNGVLHVVPFPDSSVLT